MLDSSSRCCMHMAGVFRTVSHLQSIQIDSVIAFFDASRPEDTLCQGRTLNLRKLGSETNK